MANKTGPHYKPKTLKMIRRHVRARKPFHLGDDVSNIGKKLQKQGWTVKNGVYHPPSKSSKSGKKGGGKTSQANLFDPSEILRDKDLRKAVQAIVRLQTKPALRQANRQIGEIEKQRDYEIAKAQGLGQQAAGNIRKYYGGLAVQNAGALQAQRASGQALTGAIAGQGVNTQQAITQAGQGATAGIGAYQGQDISARDQLQQLIAQQSSQAAREQTGLNAQAQSQANAFTGLQSGLGQAAQMTGGSQVSDILRATQGQEADIRARAGQDLSKVRGAKSDIMAERPDLFSKALSDQRESERNFLLSLGALKIDRKKLAGELSGKTGGIAYSNVSTKNYAKLNEQKAKLERERIKLQNKANHSLLTQKQKDRLDYLNQAKKTYGGGSGSGSSDGWRSMSATFSYLRSGVSRKRLANDKRARKAAYDNLRKYGASDKTARAAIKRYVKQYKKKHGTGRTNTVNPGTTGGLGAFL